MIYKKRNQACNFATFSTKLELYMTNYKMYNDILAVNGEWAYYRSCAFYAKNNSTEKNFCSKRSSSSGIEMEYCNCNTRDGCNS